MKHSSTVGNRCLTRIIQIRGRSVIDHHRPTQPSLGPRAHAEARSVTLAHCCTPFWLERPSQFPAGALRCRVAGSTLAHGHGPPQSCEGVGHQVALPLPVCGVEGLVVIEGLAPPPMAYRSRCA